MKDVQEIKFKAWDNINNRWIQLRKVIIATDGKVMAVEDLEGETYGLHQVTLFYGVKLKAKVGVGVEQ